MEFVSKSPSIVMIIADLLLVLLEFVSFIWRLFFKCFWSMWFHMKWFRKKWTCFHHCACALQDWSRFQTLLCLTLMIWLISDLSCSLFVVDQVCFFLFFLNFTHKWFLKIMNFYCLFSPSSFFFIVREIKCYFSWKYVVEISVCNV